MKRFIVRRHPEGVHSWGVYDRTTKEIIQYFNSRKTARLGAAAMNEVDARERTPEVDQTLLFNVA